MLFKHNPENLIACLASIVNHASNKENASGPYILVSKKFEDVGAREEQIKEDYGTQLDLIAHNTPEADALRNVFREELKAIWLEKTQTIVSMIHLSEQLKYSWAGEDITEQVNKCLSHTKNVELYATDCLNRYFKQLSAIEVWVKTGFASGVAATPLLAADPTLMLAVRTIERTVLEANIVPKVESGMYDFKITRISDLEDAISIASDILKIEGVDVEDAQESHKNKKMVN